MAISVIVPVYNCVKYLRYCVESIFSSGLPDIQCILIDDGSDDGSSILCDSLFQERPDKIVIKHKINGGVSEARNTGIDLSVGEWITFVDADDWIEKGNFDFLKTNYDIYCLNMQMYYKKPNKRKFVIQQDIANVVIFYSKQKSLKYYTRSI